MSVDPSDVKALAQEANRYGMVPAELRALLRAYGLPASTEWTDDHLKRARFIVSRDGPEFQRYNEALEEARQDPARP